MSIANGIRVGIVFKTPEGTVIKQAVRLGFKTCNNEAKYEALIVGLQKARKLGVQDLVIRYDSQLVANQLTDDTAINERMGTYIRMAQKLIRGFRTTYIEKVPKTSNSHADALATLAYTVDLKLKRTIEVEYLSKPSIESG